MAWERRASPRKRMSQNGEAIPSCGVHWPRGYNHLQRRNTNPTQQQSINLCSWLLSRAVFIMATSKGGVSGFTMTKNIPEIFQGKKYLDPQFEPAFRVFFEDEDTLREFLNSILHLEDGRKIKSLTFKFEEKMHYRLPELRKATFDIFAYTEDDRYLNIEMQRADHPFFIDRVFYYNAFLTLKAKASLANSSEFKALSREERCQRRYELPEIISIWICGFHPRDGVSDISDTWAVYSQCDLEKGTPLPVFPKNKYIILDLPAYAEKCNKTDSSEHLWLYLLANAGKELDLPDGGSDVVKRAIERITIKTASEDLLNSQEKHMIDQDEIDCRLADGYLKGQKIGLEEGRKKGLEEGRKKGLEEGRAEGRAGMFSAMERLNKGDSVEDISRDLSLSLDIVKQLKEMLGK